MRATRFPSTSVVVLLLCLILGCDTDDAASVKITIGSDFGARVRLSRLVLAPVDRDLVEAAKAVQFNSEARLIVTSGTAEHLDTTPLMLWDASFTLTTTQGAKVLVVQLPRGAGAEWIKHFVPIDEATRAKASATLDPDADAKRVGKLVKITVELPTDVVASGTWGASRKVTSEHEKKRATLTIPVNAVIGADALTPLIWHVTF